jgi:hypothetical protein
LAATNGLLLVRAFWSSRWEEASSKVVIEVPGDVPPVPYPRFGEDDTVVVVVVAVRGLSAEVGEMVDFVGAATLPPNSSFLILDFKSSNSSQTVDGAVVETLDSVPSCFGFI